MIPKSRITRVLEVAILFTATTLSMTKICTAGPTLNPERLGVPPVIDGNLDDLAWQGMAPLEPVFITFEPGYGEEVSEKTEIWMGYDDINLYFAFLCHDSQPERIKATFTARDQIDDDDAIAVSLDTQNNQQVTRWFIVNPYGIQRDLINLSDESVDWVWYSAGKFVPEGYQVEIAIPLASLPYQGGAVVPMGMLFGRAITRESIVATWPAVKPEQNIATVHATAIFHDLANSSSFEVLPIVTYGAGNSRISPGKWGNGFQSREFGGNIKYHQSATMTLEATVNPDFSHVESDAFQMDLNQRYPVFYSEKRPYFMEGMDVFGLSYGGSNIGSSVNTRAILAPSASVKMTGTTGRASYGVLMADDSGENPFKPNDPGIGDSRYAVGRVKYQTGGENFAGLLYSGHTRTDRGNQALAADSYQRYGRHTFRLTGFTTRSNVSADNKHYNGGAGTISYNYASLPLDMGASFETYSRYFRMDTAFYNRTGFNRAGINLTPHYYTRFTGFDALKEISPYVNASFVHDLTTGRDDRYFDTGVNANFVRKGYLNANLFSGHENWAGRAFEIGSASINGGLQINHRVTIITHFKSGKSIYYDQSSPWLGNSRTYGCDLTVQPVERLSQTISGMHSELHRRSDDYMAYSVNILNSRTTYQFNRLFFVRAIVQYDSGSERLLSDLLASFTLVPGSVLHVGYGGISQRNEWDGESWRQVENASLVQLEKRFFMKISYLYRY